MLFFWSCCCRLPKDRFQQLAWRPRVPSLLPKEKEEEIKKNLKEYSKRYEEEDEALLLQVRHSIKDSYTLSGIVYNRSIWCLL